MNSQVVENNSHLATFETIVAYGTSNETNQDSTSLPPFGNITQSDQVEENKRDILMPIQQNIIGSSTNFAQIPSRVNGSISPLSKGNTPSSGFSTSSEEQEIEKAVRKKILNSDINLTQLKQTQHE